MSSNYIKNMSMYVCMASRSSSDNKIRKNLIWRYSSSAVPGTVAAAAAAVAEQIDSRKDVTSRCRLGVDESGTLVLDLHRVPWPTVMSLCSKTTPPPEIQHGVV